MIEGQNECSLQSRELTLFIRSTSNCRAVLTSTTHGEGRSVETQTSVSFASRTSIAYHKCIIFENCIDPIVLQIDFLEELYGAGATRTENGG